MTQIHHTQRVYTLAMLKELEFYALSGANLIASAVVFSTDFSHWPVATFEDCIVILEHMERIREIGSAEEYWRRIQGNGHRLEVK